MNSWSPAKGKHCWRPQECKHSGVVADCRSLFPSSFLHAQQRLCDAGELSGVVPSDAPMYHSLVGSVSIGPHSSSSSRTSAARAGTSSMAGGIAPSCTKESTTTWACSTKMRRRPVPSTKQRGAAAAEGQGARRPGGIKLASSKLPNNCGDSVRGRRGDAAAEEAEVRKQRRE